MLVHEARRPRPKPTISGEPNESLARKRILDGALKLLARNGVRNTTVVDVHNESDVSRPTIYSCFGHKDTVEKIYDALINRSLIELDEVVRNATGPLKPDDPEYWRRATQGLVEFFRKRRQLARLFFGPKKNPRTKACTTLENTVYPILAEKLVQLYGRKQLKAPKTVAKQLGCSLLQIMHAYLHQTEKLSEADVVELILNAPAVRPKKAS